MKIKQFATRDLTGEAVYVGIDPSLTGFAISVFHGTDYDIRVLTPASTGGQRLREIREYVIDFLRQYDVVDVFMEGLAFAAHSASASKLGELSGVLKEALYSEFGLLPALVPPTTLKKYVVGTGKSVTKSLMMLQTYKKWGVELTDDNAADAYGLSRMCSGQADTAYEAEIVLRMADEKYRD